MKLINKCKKAAILATVMGGICFSSNVDAATVLIGGATDYTTGTQIGAINGSWVTSYVDTTVVHDSNVGWYDPALYLSYLSKKDKFSYDGYIGTHPKYGDLFELYYIWENHPDYKNMTKEEFFSDEVTGGLDGLRQIITSGDTTYVPNYLANDCDIHRVVVNGKAYAYIRQTTSLGTVAMDGILIDLSKWSESGSGQYKGKTDSVNSHGVAGKGNFVYMADYTGCRIAVGELSVEENRILNRSDLTIDLQKDLAENAGIDFSDDTYYIHGENLMVDGNYLYVLTNVNKGGQWTNYQPSYLIKYKISPNGKLTYVDYTTMGMNTDTVRLDKYNNHILTTAIGGYQNYGNPNQTTSLDFASINEDGKFGASDAIKIPQNVKDAKTEFRNIRILPNGTAYVLCYAISAGGNKTGMTVFKTTVSNLLADTPKDWEVVIANGDSIGWFNGIDAEYYTKRVWVREGNNLTLYVDGKKVHTWKAEEFATSDMFTTMQAFDVMAPEGISGKLAKLNALADKVTNDNAVWNNNATVETVTDANSISGNATITADASKVDLDNNISAAVYAKDNDVSITAGNLQLQSENSVATPVGIYAGNGKEVNIKADKVNIITKGYEDGNSLTNAIWLDPDAEGTQAKITIEAPVNIAMTDGFGGNGIAIQKTDRWGESSTEAAQKAEVIIKGDVSVKGADNQTWGIVVNSENVFSRFNNAGILAAVNNSSVTVDGNVYMDVYGNGIATTAKGSTVTVKGGEITVPTGMDYGYYTLASYLGTINMNTGADGATAGSDTVKLDGDIFALKDTGNINLALTTAESYLNGAIDNGGNVKLYLQNGATWNNVANNSRYYLDSEDAGSLVGSGRASHVNTFVGGATKENAGVIYQGLNSENIKIDSYSGNAVVLYEHNDENKLTGGNVTIGSAAENSFITLRTNYNSSMEDATTRDAVLDDMANKLYYTAYTQNERNLSGNVEIAEGLLTSAKTMYYSGIAFSDVSGQGYAASGGVVPEPEPEVPPVNPDVPGGDEPVDPNPDNPNPEPGGDEPEVPPVEPEGTKYVINTNIYHNSQGENRVDHSGVTEAVVSYQASSQNSLNVLQAAGHRKGDANLIIEMGGKNLEIIGNTEAKDINGIYVDGNRNYGTKGIVKIDNVGDLTIEANSSNKDYAHVSAIYAGGSVGKSEVVINTVDGNKTVTLKTNAEGGERAMVQAVKDSKITINGILDTSQTNNEAVRVGAGSEVAINGGVLGGIGSTVAIRLEDGGKVKINQDGTKKVVTNGAIILDGEGNAELVDGERSIIYGTEDSAHNGAITNNGSNAQNFAVEFRNGADWTGDARRVNLDVLLNGEGTEWTGSYDAADYDGNVIAGKGLTLTVKDGAVWNNTKTSASDVASLNGANGFVNMGVGNLNIASYSGDTTFVYNNVDGVIAEGGAVTVATAAENSSVTMRTAYNASLEDATIREQAFDDLAEKLTYTAYVQEERNLTGKVEIAEGLLTGAVTKFVDDIAFNAESGQGYIEKESEPVVPPVEPEGTKYVINTNIYHNSQGENRVDHSGVTEAVVSYQASSQNSLNVLQAAGHRKGDANLIIEMGGKNLEIIGNTEAKDINGIYVDGNRNYGTKGIVKIDNVGDLTIEANSSNKDYAHVSAIYAGGSVGKSEVVINTVDGNKTVTLKTNAEGGERAMVQAVKDSKITINGILDTSQTNNEAVRVGAGSEVAINGGVLGGIGSTVAIRLEDGGKVKINQDGTKKVVTNGAIILDGEGNAELVDGERSIIYGTEDSAHNGAITNNGSNAQNFAVEFRNGADWTGDARRVNLDVLLNGEGTEWTGSYDAADYDGNVIAGKGLTLTVKDGAVWNNTKTSASDVASLNGANGFVNMGVGNLNIASYSGDTTFVYNNVDGVIAEGGAVTVATAAENSSVTMRTAYNASLEDATIREQAFDDLAEKLTYTAYVQEERNLTGKVEIAEGLLTGAVTKFVDDIAFNAESGQGYIENETEPEVPPVEPPVEDDKEETFDKGFTGDITTDSENFKDANGNSIVEVKPEEGKVVIDFGKLNEGKEEGKEKESFKIDVPVNNEEDAVVSAIQAPVIEDAEGNKVEGGNTEIDMGGKEFTGNVKAIGKGSDAYGIVAKDSHIQVNNVGNITLNAEATGDGGSASALLADGKNIELTTLQGSVVTLKASDNAGESDKSTAVLQAQNAGNVTINGKVDITDTKGKDAVSVGKGSTVTIGGGEIGDEGGVAVRVNEEGKVNIGGTEQVNIKGKIIFGEVNEPVTTVKSSKFMSRSLPVANVNIDLTKAGSTLEDDLQYTGSGSKNIANVQISGKGSEWTGNSVGGINLNVVLDEDGVWKGYHEDEQSYAALNMQISNGAIWENTAKENDATNVNSLSGDGGYIQMSRNAGTDLNIGAYSGSTTFVYKNNDGNITGGNLKIESVAGDKATVNLRTNSFNGVNDEDKVVDVLNKLASKLYYQEADQTKGGVTTAAASDAKLSGELQIAEGLLTDEGTMKFAGISFGIDGKVENVTADKVQIRNDGFQTTETTAVRIAKSAMGSSVMMWRNESDDVMQRMGDLRLGTEENGIWAKYYNGNASYNENNTIYSSDYKAYQVGYDKKLDNGWTIGAALSYNDAEHKYEMGTKGEGTAVGVTAYGAWNNDKGHFANIAVKGNQLDNEFDVTNATRDLTASGDYSTWGLSVSAEYGRRIEQSNGFYVEPSAKLTIGRVQDADYTVTTDDGQKMFVEQGGFNSIVGEFGLGMGKRFERGTVFTKLALAHEFAGDFSSSFMDTNSRIVKSDADFGGSWYEWQLGGSVKVNDNSYVYATYEKTFGGDAARDWRVDAGVRWTF